MKVKDMPELPKEVEDLINSAKQRLKQMIDVSNRLYQFRGIGVTRGEQIGSIDLLIQELQALKSIEAKDIDEAVAFLQQAKTILSKLKI